jgi:hypothetical protein
MAQVKSLIRSDFDSQAGEPCDNVPLSPLTVIGEEEIGNGEAFQALQKFESARDELIAPVNYAVHIQQKSNLVHTGEAALVMPTESSDGCNCLIDTETNKGLRIDLERRWPHKRMASYS